MATRAVTGMEAAAAALDRAEAARRYREIVAQMRALGATAARERRILAVAEGLADAMRAQRAAGIAFDLLHTSASALEAAHGFVRPAIRAPREPPDLPEPAFWSAPVDPPIGDWLRRWRGDNPGYGEG